MLTSKLGWREARGPGEVSVTKGDLSPGADAVCGHFAMSRRLAVERVCGPEALGGIVAEWELLDRETSPRTPYSSPAWIIPWWKHFSRCRQILFHDESFCHVVRSDGGRLVAVAPLMRSSFPGVGRPVLRMVQFFGADPALTEMRGVICRPDDEVAVVEALVEHFLARRAEWDVFRWAGLRQPAFVYDAFRSPFAFVAQDDVPNFVVDLPKSWEDLRLKVSSNMRKNLRKPYKYLKRDGFAIAVRVTERPDGVAAAWERFLALHAARAEAADMIIHSNKFVQPRARTFFADYLHGSADRGALRIFELEVDGTVVASRVAFLIGSDLYLHVAGYDPAWKTYSVMTVLMAEMFKWALAHGVERVNLSTGHDQSKVRWKPREVLFHTAVQVSPTLRARMTFGVFRAYETYGRLREGLKTILRQASNANLRSRPLNEAGRWHGRERSVPRRGPLRIGATGASESELTG
jgi:CelD/BcsL family acetyltransferase involved in cellulose biosynthesis